MCPPPLFYRQINCLSLPSAPPCHMPGTRSLRIADVHLRQKHIRKTLYLYAQLVENRYELLVKRLVRTYGIAERHVDNLVVAHAYHHVALPLHYSVDCSHAGAARQNAVVRRRASSALQMAEN